MLEMLDVTLAESPPVVGQHCFVTGGSSGAGLALAVLLVKRGAHVSIVARNEERLQAALAELEVSHVRSYLRAKW